MNSVTIPWWFDRHLHLRDGAMLADVLPSTLNQRTTGAVIMGNLPHPYQTSTIEAARAYRQRIDTAIRIAVQEGRSANQNFLPCMTCYLTDNISPEEVVRGFDEGVWCAVKLYMADQQGLGGTTGSQHGVRNLLGRYKVFEAMERRRIPLLGHFEAVEDDVDEFDREIFSTDRDLKPLLDAFPTLPVVFEHITDSRAAAFVADASHDIYATVTAHHLMINRNAMYRGGMSPLHYCKPVPKRECHRLRIRQYVTSGHRRFGAGTDSAPHDVGAKSRCCGCAAGIFTAPRAVEMYATVFDQDDALQHLGSFLSKNFLHIYGVRVSSEVMTLVKSPSTVPEEVGTVKVFKGGTELPWSVASLA